MSTPPPDGFTTAADIIQIAAVRWTRQNPDPLRLLVRGEWVPARLDNGIGAQPRQHRGGVPPHRQSVQIKFGTPPFPESRRVPAEHVAVPEETRCDQ